MVSSIIAGNPLKFYLKDESVDKKFFASLDVLKYHRFAEKIESGDSKRKNVLQAEVFRSLWDEANRHWAHLTSPLRPATSVRWGEPKTETSYCHFTMQQNVQL